MARQKVTKWENVDDLTGEVIPEGTAHEVHFRIDATSWDLLLSPKSAAKLTAKLEPFLSKVEPKRKRTRAVNNQAVRAWAAKRGIEVGERGRIPERLIRDYLNAIGESPF